MRLQNSCVNCCQKFDLNLIVREIIIDKSSSLPSKIKGKQPIWKSLKVNQVLSSVYNFGLIQDGTIQGEDEEVAVCGDCAVKLTNLYRHFDDFNRCRQENSYLSYKIAQVESCLTDKVGQMLPQPSQQNGHSTESMNHHHEENNNNVNGETAEVDEHCHNNREVFRRALTHRMKIERDSVPEVLDENYTEDYEPDQASSLVDHPIDTSQHHTIIKRDPLAPIEETHHDDDADTMNGESNYLNNENEFNDSYDHPSSNVIEVNTTEQSHTFFLEDETDPLAMSGASAPPTDEDADDDDDDVQILEDCNNCALCGDYFLNPCDLGKHYYTCHVQKGSSTCPICSKKLSRNYLMTHLKLHAGYRPFSCEKEGCSATFISSSHLFKHLSNHQNQSPLKKKKSTNMIRKSHPMPVVKREIVEGQNETNGIAASSSSSFNMDCPLCSINFDNSDELANHIFRDHITPRSVICPICHISLTQRGTLKMHIMRHHAGGFHADNKKPRLSMTATPKNSRPRAKQICLICSKTFSSAGALATHLMLHTGEKPFKCLDCEYACLRRNNLSVHCRKYSHRKGQQ